MNLKLNLICILAASMFGLVLFQDNLKAQLIPDHIIDITGSILSVSQNWRLIDKIEEGKQLLESSAPLRFVETPQKNKKGIIIKDRKGQPILELTQKEIALAILDIQTGQIFEKRYWLDTIEINKANELRKKYLENPDHLPKFQPSNTNEEFLIIVHWWNSFNSDLSVVKEGDTANRYIVVANKYLMLNEDLVYPEDQKGLKYSDIVYVPYSPALKDKTLIATGKQFLNDYVSEAFKELTEAGVKSKTFPNRLITETLTQAFIKNIILTEQTDPKMMIISTDGGKELVERVFIRLGANGEKAFRYTVSRAGASGLGQIMPATYASMFKIYSSAQLIKNVDIGRVDVKNGIKATILVLDDHLGGVKNRAYANGSAAKKRFDALTTDKLEETRGMAYNGGPNKYNTATGGLNLKVKGATETLGFIQKFRMIRGLNLFSI